MTGETLFLLGVVCVGCVSENQPGFLVWSTVLPGQERFLAGRECKSIARWVTLVIRTINYTVVAPYWTILKPRRVTLPTPRRVPSYRGTPTAMFSMTLLT